MTLLAALLCSGLGGRAAAADIGKLSLDGHVLPALADATKVTLAAKRDGAEAEPLTLTIVPKRSDQAGFERYLDEVYDPNSAQFRRFLSPGEVSDRFGPSAADYAAIAAYVAQHGFRIVEESANRMTLTIAASRAIVESTFDVTIKDYVATSPGASSGRGFHANDRDPSLPRALAGQVQSVVGLSNFAQPAPVSESVPPPPPPQTCGTEMSRSTDDACSDDPSGAGHALCAIIAAASTFLRPSLYDSVYKACLINHGYSPNNIFAPASEAGDRARSASWLGSDGSGQKIGLLEFDNFRIGDISDYLALIGAPADRINNLSAVAVNGGTPPGANQDEVLLDINIVMGIAPGAQVVVYDAPFSGSTSFQTLFNAMINDGVTIISNSWAYCEDQTSLADVQSIDTILQTAAASGISVFNASGDSGSTCLDGSPNTVAVPAGSPSATAVGGTTLTLGPGATYAGETWWNGVDSTPSTGQGGFGASRFFARPSYQNGLNGGAMRSVPDVAINADPAKGVLICRADAGGCPNGLLYGGTSMAAPIWAAAAALLNEAQGSNLGALNSLIYPLANTDAFHDADSMGSDFAHVGLGSLNLNNLHLLLSGETAGTPSSSVSEVVYVATVRAGTQSPARQPVPADGVTAAAVVVSLLDANGNSVSGKTVTLSANAGSHATISPTSGISTVANGAVVFNVTDLTPETLTLTATDTTDGVVLQRTAIVTFDTPSAASAGIMAFPTSVAADGVSATAITVTLKDALGRPTPGKLISLAQSGTRSVVTGPNPPVTDANGQIVFTATDAFEETVTYTAVDVTDGNLPVPGTAVVTFSGSVAGSCVTPPSAADGYTLTSFANGFAAYPFFFGNVNWGCRGATDAAFDADGNAYVSHFPTGTLYRFGPDGGSATAPLATGLGPALGTPVFGRDGRLYVTHGATTGDFFTGDIVELDAVSGELLRVLASGLTCPGGLSTDPLSGDLFFDDICYGAGSENASLFRITDPAGTDPDRPTAVTVYATLPRTPNGIIAFAPDGTIYVETGYLDPAPAIVAVSGTDRPQPPVIETVAGVTSIYWLNVGATQSDGSARSLIVLQNSPSGTGTDLNLVDITTDPVQVTTLAHNIGSGTIGRDGCLYTALPDTVYRLAPESGVCDFAATNPSPALDLAPRIATPNPAQGSTQTLTASFRNLVIPTDTPVFFQIGGANAQLRLARTDANGVATIEYTGTFAGNDVIVANATVDSVVLTSNTARVTWTSGPHATFLSLPDLSSAIAGQPILLTAALSDVAANSPSAIAGATLQFSVGSLSCSATSAANGTASCSVTLPNPGVYTLTVSYAGSAQFLPTSRTTTLFVPTDGIDRIFADGFDGPD